VNEVIDYSMGMGFVTGCDRQQLAIDSARAGKLIQYIGDR
jgi:hypothetical protein